MSAADVAVLYVLRRIKNDPRLAYHFGRTEALALLCTAHAESTGIDAAQFKTDFEASLRTEPPRCRYGECAAAGAA